MEEFDLVLFKSVAFVVVFCEVQGTGVEEANVDVEADGYAPLAL